MKAVSIIIAIVMLVLFIIFQPLILGELQNFDISSDDAVLFALVAPLFFSLILSLIILLAVILPRMKTASKKIEAFEYVVNTSNVEVKRDEFLYETST